MTLLRRLIPRSLTGQLVALAITALALAQVVMLLMFAQGERRDFRERFQTYAAARIADVTHLLAVSPVSLHETIFQTMESRRWRFQHTPFPPPPPEAERARVPGLEDLIRTRLAEHGIAIERVSAIRVPRPPQPEGRQRTRPCPNCYAFMVEVVPLEGPPLYSLLRAGRRPPVWQNPLVGTTIATGLFLIGMLIFAARRVTEPLSDLARGADRLGTEPGQMDIPERGPDDVRRTIRAFNRMDRRMERMLSHQRRMIAAVGHDLRTPLTALRVRAEFVSDEDNRGHLIRIIDEMQAMTEGILSLVREDAREEPRTRTDLDALVDSLCSDFQDMGSDVTFTSPGRCVRTVRTGALSRVLRNLIENALRYGERARVALCDLPNGGTRISVEDDGPGIDPAALDSVFEPFVRLEISRSAETGGLGLGLTIARNLAEAEGGTLILENRQASGLCATLTLPPDRR